MVKLKRERRWEGVACLTVLVYTLHLATLRLRPSFLRPRLTWHINSLVILLSLSSLTTSLLPLLLLQPSPLTHLSPYGLILFTLLLLFIICVGLTPRYAHPIPGYPISPEQTTPPIQYFFTYLWLQPLVRLGYARKLELDDLPPLPAYDDPEVWRREVEWARKGEWLPKWIRRWVPSKQGKIRRTLLTVILCLRRNIAGQCLFALGMALFDLGGPIAMNRLLRYLETPSSAGIKPAIWVFFMFAMPVLKGACWQAYLFISTRLIVRVRLAFIQELYAVTLRAKLLARPASKEDESIVGRISNLMSTDVENIFGARDIVHISVTAPIECTIAVIFLYNIMGASSLFGFLVMLVSIPLPAFLTRQLTACQRQVLRYTDARMGTITELLHSIKVFKAFGWDPVVIERVHAVRAKELARMWMRNIWSVAIVTTADCTPMLTMLVTFFFHTVVMHHRLDSSVAFTAMAVFELLRQQFVYASNIARLCANAVASIGRLNAFLQEQADHEIAESRRAGQVIQITDDAPWIQDGTFEWPSTGFRLQKLNVRFVKGALNAIVGPTGSGKSSLLLALLGEMPIVQGQCCLPRMPRGIAYVSQSSWLRNATVRENILFGCAYDEMRYHRVLFACGLIPDLRLMEYGDQTELGEKGATLSGGQRARLSFARAVYSSAHTLLLDDVFSALDVHTVHHVFDNCIRGEILQERTVILVTHFEDLVAPVAALVLRVVDGRLEEVRLAEPAQDTSASEETVIEPELPPIHSILNGNPNAIRLVKDEERAVGRLPKTMIFRYMLQFGGWPVFILAISVACGTQLAFLSTTFWVALWTNAQNSMSHLGYYCGGFAIVLAIYVCLSATSSIILYSGAWNAARKIHMWVTIAVFRSPIGWFDTNPLGRIQNRFSRDFLSVDTLILPLLKMVVDNALRAIFRLAAITTILPVFAVPAIFTTYFAYWAGNLYTATQMSVKRIVAVEQSPIFNSIADTLRGAETIRAFDVQPMFLSQLQAALARSSRALEANFNSNRWFCVRIDWASGIVAVSAGALALYMNNPNASLVGFSLNNAVGMSLTLMTLLRGLNDFEVELVSYQRLMEYTMLKTEPTPTPQGKPPAAWPIAGRIEVRNLRVRYFDDAPDVLKDLSFTIRPGEKVGIVGRTGSGKSTLALALLRLIPKASGQIMIDDIDIDTLNLDDLRQAISLIPQEPLLFSGTTRTNLDPFDAHDDAELNVALNSSGIVESMRPSRTQSRTASTVGLESITKGSSPESPEGEKVITLETLVAEGGQNFSQGQRQILALVRAIVRRCKVLLLDEATASVDRDTDERIQASLQAEFGNCTILTIAHRLRSIITFDKVLVLDKGEIKEFDTPSNLIRSGGIFASLVEKGADADELKALAGVQGARS
ncbi:P-loop containing nucleoside triphosphate hydrolase protein [Dacryopinax primogenitus]|uniref:p-loop containing nucleoside triphosphate hydrolase protein n=1 Tax=Dacryopinax primogenitus (strain DJM 731) TaxID=1858805 RepID=M5G9S0_DACPD|nr:P-loop containing nucleoside triphosphate hydrolase protein [Dacryopinax primogenitus]EJU00578.1 P-loop containing nucleoside triphosphate hydrolase protein [Dacryopinax primogenitus]